MKHANSKLGRSLIVVFFGEAGAERGEGTHTGKRSSSDIQDHFAGDIRVRFISTRESSEGRFFFLLTNYHFFFLKAFQ